MKQVWSGRMRSASYRTTRLVVWGSYTIYEETLSKTSSKPNWEGGFLSILVPHKASISGRRKNY